jgi:predicted nucleic acid-binding Zn ribbon protein
VLLGQSVRDLVAERGWAGPTAVAGVVGRWPEIVGAQIAEHVQPEGFDVAAGRLLLRADSTAWATVMGYEVARVKERISQEVGPGVVRHVTVVGPTAPSWRHGSRSVPGRGPRDTYG